MRAIICATIVVLLVGSAVAQDFFGITWFPTINTTTSPAVLSKAERGKAMVGHCYSTCAHRYQKTTIDMLENFDEIYEGGQQCFMAQTLVRSIDACAAACADVERVFGINDSEAKNRFNAMVAVMREDFESSGLWTAHDDFAARGTAEFETACEEFLGYCDSDPSNWSPKCIS